MTYLDRLREALDGMGCPYEDDGHHAYRDDLAALLAERDALAAVAEAARTYFATLNDNRPASVDDLRAMNDAENAIAAGLAAYDRAVSKP